ncbi:hypothetical protein D3C76_340280 [compost metagenome]
MMFNLLPIVAYLLVYIIFQSSHLQRLLPSHEICETFHYFFFFVGRPGTGACPP